MQTQNYTTLNSLLSQHPMGCQWSAKKGFFAADNTAAKPGSATITVISQVFSPLNLDAVLNHIHRKTTITSVRLHPSSTITSVTGIVVDIEAEEQQWSELNHLCLDLGHRYLIDIVFQQTRPKLVEPGLLIMDMDSTMIRMECIDEIARACGRYEEVSAVTREAMNGSIDFAQSLTRRVACLEGVKVDDLNSIRLRMPLMPGLANLVSQLKAKHWKVAVASGGFTFFADYLCDWLNLDSALSNVLEIEDGTLTGKVVGDIVDASAKRKQLLKLQQEYQLATAQTIAVGDGANDLPMLSEAGLGVAFHAKPNVRKQAGAVITHQPLDALLMLFD